MININPILAHIRRAFRVPEINLDWVRQCAQALQDEGHEPSPQAILEQYTYADLAETAAPSLPGDISTAHEAVLFSQPTLLQITAITEIGSSAVTLQNTLEQRRDVLSGRTRIRGLDEGDGEEEEFVPGKLPDYPRGMLKLELSDGVGIVQAMEYRRVGEFKLGETKLGCKVLLHRVKVLRGILLLTPQNTKVIGGEIEALDLAQPEQFVESLQRRIEAASNPPAIPSSSKRPKTRNTSAGAGPSTSRGKKPKVETKAAPQTRAGHLATTSLLDGSSTGPGTRTSSTGRNASASKMGRRSMPITIDDTDDELDAAQRARQARAAAILAAATGPDHSARSNDEMEGSSDEYGLNDDADQSFLRHVELAEAAAKEGKRGVNSNGFRGQGGYGVQEEDMHDEFDQEEDGWADDSFLRHIDQVEAAASGTRPSRSGAGGSRGHVQPTRRGQASGGAGVDDEDGYSEGDVFARDLDDSVTFLPTAPFGNPRSSGTERTSQNSRGRSGRGEIVGRRGGSTQTPIEIIEISD